MECFPQNSQASADSVIEFDQRKSARSAGKKAVAQKKCLNQQACARLTAIRRGQ